MRNLDLSRLLGGKHFLQSILLHSHGAGIQLRSLINTGAQGYLFLNSSFAYTLARKLKVAVTPLPHRIMVKGFSDQIQTPASYCVRLHITINERTIQNYPFVIMDLGQQDCIIGIQWLRRFKVQLDTQRNRLLWPPEYPPNYNP